MMKKKLKTDLISYCLLFSALIIVSGCATADKKTQIMSLQKQRIVQLEQQIKKKNRQIHRLKANKWVKSPVKVPAKVALRPLRKKINNKQWIEALKLSGKLKKRYPRSRKLAEYRYIIFKNMGLTKQAQRERLRLKKLQAKRRSRSKVR